MTDPATDRRRWTSRAARARALAGVHPASAELLLFYAGLAEAQHALLIRIAPPVGGAPGIAPGPFLDALDLEAVASAMGPLAAWVAGAGPPALAEAAAEVAVASADERRALLRRYRPAEVQASDLTDQTAFLVEATFQPAAEALALAWPAGAAAGPAGACCPVCGGRPVAGVLREEALGAKRSLVCGLCLTEWTFLRTRCAACAEERSGALPVYVAEQFPHVRVEACDTCRAYLKSVDLTKAGEAEPLVDDLASLALDLWAVEQGYTRIRPNLMRV